MKRPLSPGKCLRLEALEDRIALSTLTVFNNLDDGSAGSLRAVIAQSQSGDTIDFDTGLQGKTITLNSAVSIAHDLTITGLGAANLAVSGNKLNQASSISNSSAV